MAGICGGGVGGDSCGGGVRGEGGGVGCIGSGKAKLTNVKS